jgi:methyl-accepting chemotaxis protein
VHADTLRSIRDQGVDDVSTAEQPGALARRIEQLAAAASAEEAAPVDLPPVDLPPVDLAPVVEALRAEIGALRSELTARVDAAVAEVQTSAAGRAGPGGPGVRSSAGPGARSSAGPAEGARSSAGPAEGAGAALEARLAVLESSRDALAERLDALVRDSATTAGLLQSLAEPLLGLDDRVRTELDHVREAFEERTEQLAGVLARGLTDIADEVDVAATTTRDASERVTVLAEVSEVQRAEVERLLQGVRDEVQDSGRALREELLARTTQQLAALGQRLDQLQGAVAAGAAGVQDRLGAVDARAAQTADAVERALAGVEAVTAASERLRDTVESFRTEWPTRTWEVVQGARAVAEAVVLDVRAEVGGHLQDVRAVLQQVVGTVEDARSGLDDGTDRLARAGHVLVAYLEERDRLLEAERDRVLHDVLDAFAAGLSARERSALAGRVSDVVARRRDARDAERYREALGAPVPPTVRLPDDVLGLSAASSAVPEGRDGVTSPDGSEHEGTPPSDGEVDGSASAGVAEARVGEARTGDVPTADVPTAEVPTSEIGPPVGLAAGVTGGTARPPVPRPSVARGGRGGAAVVPGPGRASAAAPGARRGGAAGRQRRSAAAQTGSPRPAPGRGRLEAMPQAPSVDVALDAAAPEDRGAQDGRLPRS